jgi:hypothetical protein
MHSSEFPIRLAFTANRRSSSLSRTALLASIPDWRWCWCCLLLHSFCAALSAGLPSHASLKSSRCRRRNDAWRILLAATRARRSQIKRRCRTRRSEVQPFAWVRAVRRTQLGATGFVSCSCSDGAGLSGADTGRSDAVPCASPGRPPLGCVVTFGTPFEFGMIGVVRGFRNGP